MNTSLQIAAFTHTGLYRKRNEDSLLVADLVISGEAMKNPRIFTFESFPVLMAVADGIGGSVAGDIASREVLRFITRCLPIPDNQDILEQCIAGSTDHLDSLVMENPALDGLGTTLAGILITSGALFIFSCGDSRVYYTHPDKKNLIQLTKDHSVIQEMIDAGSLTEKEARSHPLGHIITSCLSGGRITRRPDIRITKIEPESGSRFVMCTDGVWDYGGEAFQKAALLKEINKAAISIPEICFAAGAPDNITFIIADLF